MLSYPYLRNNGYLLYRDMIHPYPPVLTMALSIVYKLFGYKLIVLKIFTWLIILANDILIFFIAKKLTKKNIFALTSLFLYVVVQPFLEGNQLWFDLAIVPSILLGLLFLLNEKYFLSGLSLGVAILTKQTSGLFLILWGLFLLIKERKLKPAVNLIIGPVVLFTILLIRLITEGAVSGFLNWILIYPFAWWSKFPGYVQMTLTHSQIMIFVLLLFPILLLLFKLKQDFIKDNNLTVLLIGMAVSFVLIYPRFSFFHFQLGIAFSVLFFGLMFGKFFQSKFYYPVSVLYLVLIAFYIIKPAASNWGKETRFWGKDEEKTADMIKNNTKPNGLVYLLGPQSGLYVLSRRLPPKPWSDNYVWYLEIPGVQENVIKGWEANKPKIVFTNNVQQGNWYDLGTYRPQKIVDWIRNEKIETSILK